MKKISKSLTQFACFDCRKAFKYEVDFGIQIPKSQQAEMRQVDAVVCPDCGQPMWLMGRKFKAPRRNNIKQWRKVEKIRKAGFRRFPKYLWQTDSVIEQFKRLSEGEKLLKKINSKTDKT